MATQRMTVVSLGGEQAALAVRLFTEWRLASSPAEIDLFCEALRANGWALPLLYFCEWLDTWLMGDLVPGPAKVEGRRFEAACLTPAEAVEWAAGLLLQCREEVWLAARLREAAAAYRCDVVVVIREPLGGCATDEEIEESLRTVPGWLGEFRRERTPKWGDTP
jgi:hypothetical protein